MLHKEFFGLIFLGFVFWIIAATTPGQRIENACRPVGWTGSVITSMSALVVPTYQDTVQGGFDRLEYGCRYTAWRLFYQDAYNQFKAKADADAKLAGGPEPVAASPDTAASAPAGAASAPAAVEPASTPGAVQ